MKKLIVFFILFFLIVSCNSPAPLEYYKRCVLNTVYIQHFGPEEILDILHNPPIRYNTSKKNFDTVSYSKIIQDKMLIIKNYLDNVNDLKMTSDAKNMISTSKEVFTIVLNGQQKYYLQLAALKEQKADDTKIANLAHQLLDNSEKELQEKLNLLWGYGKMYADANQIDLSLQDKSHNKNN